MAGRHSPMGSSTPMLDNERPVVRTPIVAFTGLAAPQVAGVPAKCSVHEPLAANPGLPPHTVTMKPSLFPLPVRVWFTRGAG